MGRSHANFHLSLQPPNQGGMDWLGFAPQSKDWRVRNANLFLTLSLSHIFVTFKNGILPITISEEQIKQIAEYSKRQEKISINLPEQKIIFGNNEINFEIDDFKKKCLMEGLDDIALSLEKSDKIQAFEKKLISSKPWVFND